jgi:hypothetical protein
LKKDSPFAFIVGIILTLTLSFLILDLLSLDLSIWVGVAVGEILLWLNAWIISRRKKKWPYKAETSQQQKKQ